MYFYGLESEKYPSDFSGSALLWVRQPVGCWGQILTCDDHVVNAYITPISGGLVNCPEQGREAAEVEGAASF